MLVVTMVTKSLKKEAEMVNKNLFAKKHHDNKSEMPEKKERIAEFYKRKKMTEDPRIDLKEDSFLWQEILVMAKKKSVTLAGILHGIRCGGARIEPGKTGFVIRGGDWEDYPAHRDNYLMPYKDDVKQMLGKLKAEQS